MLDGLGSATSGGRVADVGVGGLSTGGEISFFHVREAPVCDNIENYQVILADGSIIHANDTSHQDLFHALESGSINFGIVTRFDI